MASTGSSGSLAVSSSHQQHVPAGEAAVNCTCAAVANKMQTIADLLLLRSAAGSSDREVNAFVLHHQQRGGGGGLCDREKHRDAVVASGKGLAATIRLITTSLMRKRYADLCESLDTLADQVVAIIEATTLMAYSNTADAFVDEGHCGLVTIDKYQLVKCELDIASACERLKFEYGAVTDEEMRTMLSSVSDNVGIVTRECLDTNNLEHLSVEDKKQFSLVSQAITAAYVSFANCLKRFMATKSTEHRSKCLLLSKPFLLSIASLIQLMDLEPSGRLPPLQLDKIQEKFSTSLLGSSMAIVSSCIRFVEGIQSVMSDVSDNGSWKMLLNCSKSVAESAKLLIVSLKESTPFASRRSSITITDK